MKVLKENDQNLAIAIQRIHQASLQGADIAILPEMFCCPYETKNFPLYAQPANGSNCQSLSRCALENHIYIVGSMPEIYQDHIYNTAYVFNREGAIIAKHQKIHLFDIDVPNGQYFKESETLSAGNRITVFPTEFGPMGVMICFDIRFPELSRIMALEGAKAIIVPAAFNMTTGPAHWALSFRARALDNQVFMIGCAPARNMESSYHSYGHSIITSPWGEVLAEADETEQILYHDIDFNHLHDIRKQLPLLSSLRNDVYQLTRVSAEI